MARTYAQLLLERLKLKGVSFGKVAAEMGRKRQDRITHLYHGSESTPDEDKVLVALAKKHGVDITPERPRDNSARVLELEKRVVELEAENRLLLQQKEEYRNLLECQLSGSARSPRAKDPAVSLHSH